MKPVKRVEAEKLEHAMVHSSLLTIPLPWSQILHLYPVIVWLLKKFPVLYMEWRKHTCHYRQHIGRTLLIQYWYLSTIGKVQSVLLLHWHTAEVFPECFHTVAQSCYCPQCTIVRDILVTHFCTTLCNPKVHCQCSQQSATIPCF